MANKRRLPPHCGENLGKPLLFNPYQQAFLKARRLRACRLCRVISTIGKDGVFRCKKCHQIEENPKRIYRWLSLFAGRRGGKSVIGAYGAREEILVPNTLGWVCGPTYKILHDATIPTFCSLIPPEWVKDWDVDNMELTFINNARVQFRSLDDPDRGHAGVGLHWGWLDEAAFISPLAWNYLRPAFSDFSGACFFTSSVDGYDWTYDALEKKAMIDKVPGFWACKFRTIDNPAIDPEEVDEARLTLPPVIFRQEYEASRENFTGSVYGEWINGAWLPNDEEVKKYIPEWPEIDAERKTIIPLDSGVDHPFGSLKLVVTERGIVAVNEYLERDRAITSNLIGLKAEFMKSGGVGNHPIWCANKNEANMRLEFAAQGIFVFPSENEHKAGIQRVMSWLFTGQFKIAYTCPKLYDQMKQYRYAANVLPSGEKREKEKVFKLQDELPDCVRYGLMSWPVLPKPLVQLNQRDLSKVPAKVRREIEKVRAFHSRQEKGDELQPEEKGYPMGDFWGHADLTEPMFLM